MKKLYAALTIILALLFYGCETANVDDKKKIDENGSTDNSIVVLTNGCDTINADDKKKIDDNDNNDTAIENPPTGRPIKNEDLILGGIALGISVDDFDRLVTGVLLSETISDESEPAFLRKERLYSNGLDVLFLNFHDGRGFILFWLETTSEEHPTTRGLSVGDDVEKIYELYGSPDMEVNNEFYYSAEAEDYFQLIISTENDKVVSIEIVLIL